MSATEFAIRARRVFTPGHVRAACVHVSDGRISEISSFANPPRGVELIEVEDDAVLMPGLVDTHVHINEPGRTEWEGFATATRAAAAGGVTTLVDMPLNSIPPTTTLAGFEVKLEAARSQCSVDVGFWGGVVPGNTAELPRLWEAGVVGFKCFLIHSGVDEFPNVTETDLREAMPVLANLGAVLIVHAEVPGPISRTGIPACPDSEGTTERTDRSPTSYQTFLNSRPRAAEDEAVALMIRLSRETGCRVHIVHHSSADSLGVLRDARAERLPITVETCPHYLHFTAEEIPDSATEFKCCPPIRERENREQLWQALSDQVITMVVSDHSPCPPELKRREEGDFLQAWGGISSLQLRLPVIWTEARQRGHNLSALTFWLCSQPADLVGWGERKGRIVSGYDADFVIWNPHEEFVVKADTLQHRHKLTPYDGERLNGVVQTTFLRGQKIYDRGEFAGGARGQLLLHNRV
ncbi:MAG: allantoinase [Blastocatellia bacterium]|jgi:allantoinase|nr:allantoinase [Blastocatellia bacterium]